MINREFVRYVKSKYPGNIYKLNREEDMGLENLRKAQRSTIRSSRFEKYEARVKNNSINSSSGMILLWSSRSCYNWMVKNIANWLLILLFCAGIYCRLIIPIKLLISQLKN
jgi:hypothetical protein